MGEWREGTRYRSGVAAAPSGAGGCLLWRRRRQRDVAAARVAQQRAHAYGVTQYLNDAGGGGGHLNMGSRGVS